MLDSIQLALSGMEGYSAGLRVIAGNTANLSTPGFKGQRPDFAEQFHVAGMLAGSPGDASRAGGGLTVLANTTDWRQGELRQTGNDLDLAIDGQGLFVLKKAGGAQVYTRAGQFQFDASDTLVTRTDGSTVLARGTTGELAPISLAGLRTSPPRASTAIVFQGNLSSGATTQTIAPINVIDSNGATHALVLTATSVVDPNTPAVTTPDGHVWQLELKDEQGRVVGIDGDGLLRFIGSTVDPASASRTARFSPAGAAPMVLTLGFGGDLTNFSAGSTSTMAVKSVDGRAAGSLSKVGFDEKGVLKLSYSNGAAADGPRLALAQFDSPDAVRAIGNNQFEAANDLPWVFGGAGEGQFGKITGGSTEVSNVDLSAEFSNLVILQRGYQSSSQVLSTSNEMIQQLFDQVRRRG